MGMGHGIKKLASKFLTQQENHYNISTECRNVVEC